MKPVTILSIVLFSLGILWYFMSPLCEDIYVFLGAAHLAEIQYGGGISGAIQSWELKLIANRIFIYLLYKLSFLSVSFDDKNSFEFLFKFYYLLFILGATYSFSLAFTQKIKEGFLGLNRIEIFFFISFFILFTSFRNHLQAEYTALLISFYSIPLLLSEKNWKIFAGILLLACTFYFKGITALFGLEIILILFYYFKISQKKSITILIAWGFACFVTGVLLFLLYPQEMYDLKDATLFQKSFSQDGLGVQLKKGISYSFYNLVFC